MSNTPPLEPLFEISLETAPRQAIGETPHGNRQIVPVTGGSFAGPCLQGKVLAGGGDWTLVRPDGVQELDARLTLQTDDSALISMTYRGYLIRAPQVLPRSEAGEHDPPEEHYQVIILSFETSAAPYAWLQQVVAIGRGSLWQGGVRYRVFAVR
jgi:hypothetical protein